MGKRYLIDLLNIILVGGDIVKIDVVFILEKFVIDYLVICFVWII